MRIPKKSLPFLLAATGLVVGLGAGLVLQPETAPPPNGAIDLSAEPATSDFVRLQNQFIVPVVESGNVSALVILSLNIEVASGNGTEILRLEPKLRDGFLQVLFDHANAGGFAGSFTDNSNVVVLRRSLLEAARDIAGPMVRNVLISDLVRQDS